MRIDNWEWWMQSEVEEACAMAQQVSTAQEEAATVKENLKTAQATLENKSKALEDSEKAVKDLKVSKLVLDCWLKIPWRIYNKWLHTLPSVGQWLLLFGTFLPWQPALMCNISRTEGAVPLPAKQPQAVGAVVVSSASSAPS